MSTDRPSNPTFASGEDVIRFTCPRCDKPIKAPVQLMLRKAKCPKCGNLVTVPGVDEGMEGVGGASGAGGLSGGKAGEVSGESSGGEVDGERFEDLSTGDFGRWSDEVEKAPVAEEVEIAMSESPSIVTDKIDQPKNPPTNQAKSGFRGDVSSALAAIRVRHWTERAIVWVTIAWVGIEVLMFSLVLLGAAIASLQGAEDVDFMETIATGRQPVEDVTFGGAFVAGLVIFATLSSGLFPMYGAVVAVLFVLRSALKS